MTEFQKWLNQLGGMGLDHMEVYFARIAYQDATERAAMIAENYYSDVDNEADGGTGDAIARKIRGE